MVKKNDSPFEDWEQAELFIWRTENCKKYPELLLLNGSLCGVRLRPGQWVKAKSQGMPKGYPDIGLPVACFPWNGLYIELKRVEGGAVSPEQKWWLEQLRKQGYMAVVAKGHKAAIEIIKNYLGI